MIILFFDTETTGLPDWGKPSDADHQPHLTQVAGILCRDHKVLTSVNMMVKPDGWKIPDDLVKLTGITNEDAAAFGFPEPMVYGIISSLMRSADLIVAHNTPFDMRIIRIASKRYGLDGEADQLKAIPRECTMRQSSAIMKMAPTDKMKDAGFTKPKPPKLTEAYKHFFGKELDGAHNAMVDVNACRRIWWKLREMKEAA